MVLELFQELRSMIFCLILLGIWWCSDGLDCKVLLGHLKGLSEVCDNALKPCLSLPGCLFPTGDGRKALLPPLALSLLESFKDQSFFPSPYQNPYIWQLGDLIRFPLFKWSWTVLPGTPGWLDCLCNISLWMQKNWQARWGKMRLMLLRKAFSKDSVWCRPPVVEGLCL